METTKFKMSSLVSNHNSFSSIMEPIITVGSIQSFENSPWEFRNNERHISSVLVVTSLFLIQLFEDVMKVMCVCVDFMLLSPQFNF